MTKGKGFNVVGVLLGIAVVIWGIVFMFTPADHYSTYSSKSASFGSRFYHFRCRIQTSERQQRRYKSKNG